MKKAVFLDRDGTIIHDVGHISDSGQVTLFTDTVPALRELQQEYELFIVTNQSGIGAGLIGKCEVDQVNCELDNYLREAGVYIKAWYVCPHTRNENCQCSKPKPYFLKQAAAEYDIDLSRSFVIGDHPHDVTTADNAGAFGLYVLTGHGAKHLPELPYDKLVFHGIHEAADWILTHPEPVSDIRREINIAAEYIQSGKLVVFPTETVYGVGADAFNAGAIAEIFAVKERPSFNPLIVHIADLDDLKQLAKEIPEQAVRLADAIWPGPLTIVLPKADTVPDIVTAGKPTVAVRMPENVSALQLIRQAGVPIAAPSANKFGFTSPTTAAHVSEQLGAETPWIVDGGACRVGVESTVVSLTGDRPVILRPGGVLREAIEEIIGPVWDADEIEQSGEAPQSPGMLANHYAPTTPLYLIDDLNDYLADNKTGFLLFQVTEGFNVNDPYVEILSENADLKEAAVNLYAAMRRLDSLNLNRIIAQRLPDEGLGKAINDRLRKAAASDSTRDYAPSEADRL
ncbi:MAG: L-threonylcarbamoyladenylate synthase [Lentisphaeria bacterium]